MTIELIKSDLPGQSSWYYINLNNAMVVNSGTYYLDVAQTLYNNIINDPSAVYTTVLQQYSQ